MPAIRRTTLPGAVKFLSTVGDDEIRVVASDATPDRVNDILVPKGAQLANFRKNPIALLNHDPNQPVGTVPEIGVRGNRLEATIRFAPLGVSERADEARGLAKAGVLSAVSVGFLPITWEAIGNGGLRFVEWELCELSLCAVPMNPSAVVIERSLRPDIRAAAPRFLGTAAQRRSQADFADPDRRVRRAQLLRLRVI